MFPLGIGSPRADLCNDLYIKHGASLEFLCRDARVLLPYLPSPFLREIFTACGEAATRSRKLYLIPGGALLEDAPHRRR